MSNIIESYIKGSFHGWSGETLFRLGNGQYWVQARYAYRYHYAYRPKARISSINGKYIMEVQGMNDSIQVKRLSSGNIIESYIDGDFKGWDGETVFKLGNGQLWKQESYAYMYHYAYRPEVIIYDPGSGYKLKVDGVTDILPVRQIR